MKKSVIISCVVALAVMTQYASAQATSCQNSSSQIMFAQGPGPVIAGSFDYNKVPEKAKKFISDNFKGIKVMRVEKEFASNTYEITMQNGVEVDFNSKGEVKEIDGKNNPLSAELVKAVLPAAAYKTLTTKTLHNNVKQIDIEKGTYEVDFVKSATVKEIKFDVKGNILKIEK